MAVGTQRLLQAVSMPKLFSLQVRMEATCPWSQVGLKPFPGQCELKHMSQDAVRILQQLVRRW